MRVNTDSDVEGQREEGRNGIGDERKAAFLFFSFFFAMKDTGFPFLFDLRHQFFWSLHTHKKVFFLDVVPHLGSRS